MIDLHSPKTHYIQIPSGGDTLVPLSNTQAAVLGPQYYLLAALNTLSRATQLKQLSTLVHFYPHLIG